MTDSERNATADVVEGYINGAFDPLVEEAILFDETLIDELDRLLRKSYEVPTFSLQLVDKVFRTTHANRLKVLHECLTLDQMKKYWIPGDLNGYLDMVSQFTLVDFLAEDIVIAGSDNSNLAVNEYRIRTSHRDALLWYTFSEEELTQRKLLAARNLIAGPIHNIPFEQHLQKLKLAR